jgi:hypothetical protein
VKAIGWTVLTLVFIDELAFGLAGAGLWAAGHAALAIALLIFSAVINALALLPQVAAIQGTTNDQEKVALRGPGTRGAPYAVLITAYRARARHAPSAARSAAPATTLPSAPHG